jgi:hypothetical protein
VTEHGGNLVIEDTDIRTWFRLWGARPRHTTPGRLIAAIDRERAAVGGRPPRASTFTTALSRHCHRGQRVPKTLAQREHHCPSCRLTGDRDTHSVSLGAHTAWTDPVDPATARVDHVLAANTTIVFHQGPREVLASQPAARPHPGPWHGASRPRSASLAEHAERRRSNPGRDTGRKPAAPNHAGTPAPTTGTPPLRDES